MPNPYAELIERLRAYRVATDPAFPHHPAICSEAATAIADLCAEVTDEEVEAARIAHEKAYGAAQGSYEECERLAIRAALASYRNVRGMVVSPTPHPNP